MVFSNAVNSGSKWWNWNTKPMCRLRNALRVLLLAEDLQQRGLPRAAGAHDAHHFALGHVQVHAFQDLKIAEAFADGGCLDHTLF